MGVVQSSNGIATKLKKHTQYCRTVLTGSKWLEVIGNYDKTVAPVRRKYFTAFLIQKANHRMLFCWYKNLKLVCRSNFLFHISLYQNSLFNK